MSMYFYPDLLDVDQARIYLMAPDGLTKPIDGVGVLKGRRRGLTQITEKDTGRKIETDKISGFHQGAFPDARTATPDTPAGSIYPGDREIYDPDMLTIQIFRFNIVERNGKVYEDVLVPAFRLSEKTRKKFDIQTEARKANIDIDELSSHEDY